MKFNTQADVQRQQADAEFQRQVNAGLADIYQKYPELRPCEATSRMIVELLNRYAGTEVVPTVWLFQEARSENEELFQKSLAMLAPQIQREALIDEICDLLRSPDGTGRGGRYSDTDLLNERRKMAHWSKEQLQTRRTQIVETQRLSKLSTTELRHQHPPPRLEREPLPAEWTRERLKSKKTPSEIIRLLIERHGLAAVNARLANRG